MTDSKLLVVNADDFGFTLDVNEGIVEAHRRGILTATTLMANGNAFDDAVRLAGETPALDVGCHLVLVGGRSVVNPETKLPASVSELMRAVALRRIRIYAELAAQVRKIVEAGIRPTHLDTHKHTHLLPQVLDAVARIAEESRIPWVRRPFDLPLRSTQVDWKRRTVNRSLQFLRSRFHRVLSKHGCRTTDHFTGFQITGLFDAADLVEMIAALPAGTTEFMCHPGRCGPELRQARTRLKESREAELQALVDPGVRAAVERHQVRLTSYRELNSQ